MLPAWTDRASNAVDVRCGVRVSFPLSKRILVAVVGCGPSCDLGTLTDRYPLKQGVLAFTQRLRLESPGR